MNKIDELKEEMFKDWLWKKWYDELFERAINEVQKETGFWKSFLGLGKKINDRHNNLFDERLKALTSQKEQGAKE